MRSCSVTMKIEQIKLKDLKLYANNNKKHPESQIEVLKRSIDEFGFRNPVLIDKDTEIVAGHGRCIAAKELGLEEVPCIRIEDLSKEQIKALRIMDNKSQEYAEWDFDSLKEEFTDLDVAGYDLDLTGFSFDEIVDITADKKAKVDKSISQMPKEDRESSPSKLVHTCPSCGHEFN